MSGARPTLHARGGYRWHRHAQLLWHGRWSRSRTVPSDAGAHYYYYTRVQQSSSIDWRDGGGPAVAAAYCNVNVVAQHIFTAAVLLRLV